MLLRLTQVSSYRPREGKLTTAYLRCS